MKRTFLNTIIASNAQGERVYTQADCDSTPVVTVYSDQGLIIETPTITKCTVNYATGHYSYPLNSLLYIVDDWYYDIVEATYTDSEGDTFDVTTQRRYFQWGFLGVDTNTDNAKGYNYNLMKQFKRYLEAHLTLMSAIGHTRHLGGSVDKIRWAFTLRKLESTSSRIDEYPLITLDVKGQEKIEGVNNVFGWLRQGILEIKLWHSKAIENLVIWNDWIIEYFDISNNYTGLKLDSADGKFKTAGLRGLRTSPSPEGGIITYDERYNLYCTGSRHEIKAGLLLS